MGEAVYEEHRLAELYDALNPWQASYEFYFNRIMSADSVLDLGCGTGTVLTRARRSGHCGQLVGVDPAAAMLELARAKGEDVTWLPGDVHGLSPDMRFDLIVMTGHAFQMLLTDKVAIYTMTAVRRLLRPGGRFVFEVRNPAVSGWTMWTKALTCRQVGAPGGGTVEVAYEFIRRRPPDLVDYRTTFRFQGSAEPYAASSTLRFPEPAHLRQLIGTSGLTVTAEYGDWDQTRFSNSSPEMIVTTAAAADAG